ncbi:MAG: hypothetical protein IKA22_01310 [Lentisphaeria bacterium]|nr:hypothetical protein [Lentisphaeria bacterium]MBR4036340.1 hypothetical protein [Oscillospiraceae bacterium]
MNSTKKCHNGTFLFFSGKLVHFKLILEREPKTYVFGTRLPFNHLFVPKQADFGTFLRSYPEKFLPGSTLPDVLFAQLPLSMPQCTVSYLSGRYSFVLRDIFTTPHVEDEKGSNRKFDAKFSQNFNKKINF